MMLLCVADTATWLSAAGTALAALAAIGSWWAACSANKTSTKALDAARESTETGKQALEAARESTETGKQALAAAHDANRTANNAIAFEALSDLHKVYATAEMGDALRTVYLFKRICDDAEDPTPRGTERIQRRYLHWLGRKDVAKGSPEFDPARRLVSHFFQRMAVIREAGIVTDTVLFLGWGKGDFKVIGEAIIPMERALAEFVKEDPTETIQRLEALQKAGTKTP